MRSILLSVAVLAAFAARAANTPIKPAHRFVDATPETLSWGEAPEGLPSGSQAALLEGDPARSGDFALRLKAPSGYKIMPHTHPSAERVTVLEGTLYLGMGEKFDAGALKMYPAGSYVSLPRGHAHYAFFKDGGVVQINAAGPWGIDYVSPADDPRNVH